LSHAWRHATHNRPKGIAVARYGDMDVTALRPDLSPGLSCLLLEPQAVVRPRPWSQSIQHNWYRRL